MGMFDSLKTFLFGYEPTAADVHSQHSLPGPASAMDLVQRGWRSHRFGNSQVVILLPSQLHVWTEKDGTLCGGEDPPATTLTARLQQGFDADPSLALDFVEDMAERRGLQYHTVGTYRCFYDAGPADPWVVAERYFIVGIPGSVVTLAMRGTRDAAATIVLNQVRAAIPQLVAAMA
ncbi:hypothetical protein NA78x_001152 [Anatilimnocola sp. NA78]|uniref:hypothetical protein n=1 Tax=Anatilimnocola sp. NA78 TaxID=3415683 RepID=UPI003CE4B0E1